MKQDAIRSSLMNGTVRVVARDGLDKATTKLLAKEANLNEVYIYRFFNDKEDLFVKTFSMLDRELVDKVLQYLPVMEMSGIPPLDRCRMLFYNIWKFILGNREKCLCFVQYYYSPYFTKYSIEEHKQSYRTVVEKFTPAFKKGSDVWLLLNHILDVILASATRVFSGTANDDDQNAESVFNLIYNSVENYLSWSENSTDLAI